MSAVAGSSVLAPMAGRVRPLSEVPDPVFAAELVGSGVAVDPDPAPGAAVSPVAGRLAKVHPHAFIVISDSGTGILVHLGIDTVKLAGAGFEVLVAEGDQVAAGQPITRWDPAAIAAGGLSPLVMVCVLDTRPGAVRPGAPDAHVDAGDALFAWPPAEAVA